MCHGQNITEDKAYDDHFTIDCWGERSDAQDYGMPSAFLSFDVVCTGSLVINNYVFKKVIKQVEEISSWIRDRSIIVKQGNS